MNQLTNLYILIQGRHSIDIPESQGFVFPNGIQDPSNYGSIEKGADDFVSQISGDEVNIIVTGLTQATVSVIKSCLKYNKKLVLWHYNQSRGGLEASHPVDTGIPASMANYKAQRVL